MFVHLEKTQYLYYGLTLLIFLFFSFQLWRRKIRALEVQLEHARTQRQAERKGRIQAEIALRTMKTKTVETGEGSTFFAPIGFIKSCFPQRNGTPRQSLLVPEARAVLNLQTRIPPEALQGLEEFEYVWLLYVFHLNTNLHNDLHSGKHFKAKIQVPRLNGAKKGVFATRTPHRANNIGLSLVQVLSVEGRAVYLGGVDIVDGTPVLDVKPYLPCYDARPTAQVPDWAQFSLADPLQLRSVTIPANMIKKLQLVWKESKEEEQRLFGSYAEFEKFLRSVLRRDIRSVHQRRVDESAKKFNVVLWADTAVEYVMDGEGALTVRDVYVR